MRAFRNGMILALVMMALAASDATAQSAESFHWPGTLEQGRILEVKDVKGDVIVERASGSEIEVTAHGPGPPE